MSGVIWIRSTVALPANSGYYLAFFPEDPETGQGKENTRAYYDHVANAWNDCTIAQKGYRPTHWAEWPADPEGHFEPEMQD